MHSIKILTSLGLLINTVSGQLNTLRRKRNTSQNRIQHQNNEEYRSRNQVVSKEDEIETKQEELFFMRVLQTSLSFGFTPPASPARFFDINDCESYSLQWLVDLGATCENYPTILDGCECSKAKKLFDEGVFTCQSCPDTCSVCNTCLSVLGCP